MKIRNAIDILVRFVLWLSMFALVVAGFTFEINARNKKEAEALALQQQQEKQLLLEQQQKEAKEALEKKRKAKEMAKKRKKALARARKRSFEASMKDFPEDYQEALRALHEKYPKWKFEAVPLTMTWSEALSGEAVVGKNSIQTNPYKNLAYVSTETGAYHKETDTFVAVDAGGRYTPSEEAIAYYLDPRNFLTEELIFQFEDLSYDSYHKEAVVEKMLEGTFMEGSLSYIKEGKTKKKTYASVFMRAGKKAGVNPYHLVSRVIQEVGSGGSASVSGTTGYYNFYNIGATDSPDGSAVAKGLAYAAGTGDYQRPWTDPYKAIIGGGEFLGQEYINGGQDTLYFQKWNVINSQSLYSHQYMSNIQAPTREASMIYAGYQSMDCLEENFVFRIPVYQEMPAEVSPLPEEKEHNNRYLKEISITWGKEVFSLEPEFHYKKGTYKIRVPYEVKKITLKGTPASSLARVSGNGMKKLDEGVTLISLTCKAQNGTEKVYRVRVIRGRQEQEEDPVEEDALETEDTEERLPEEPVEEEEVLESVPEEKMPGDVDPSTEIENEIQGGEGDGLTSGPDYTNEEESSMRSESVGDPSDGDGFSPEM